jgi:hypothetical protein
LFAFNIVCSPAHLAIAEVQFSPLVELNVTSGREDAAKIQDESKVSVGW